MNQAALQKGQAATRDRMWTDREIREKTDDQFGYMQYVEVLRERILNTETPCTIGITGSWGSGKSSLMGLIEESISEPEWNTPQGNWFERFLDRCDNRINEWSDKTSEWFKIRFKKDYKKKPRVRTIWINVWELSTQEEVWHAFLQAVFTRVYKEVPWRKRIDWRKLGDKAIRSSWRLLIVIAPALAAVYLGKSGNGDFADVLKVISLQADRPDRAGVFAGIATQLLAFVAVYKPAWDAIRQTKKSDISSVLKAGSYEAQISELMKLRNRFAEVVKLAVDSDGRVVVFIDDLDRCTPDKVPEVLEAIKLFASTAGCVYVLAFDQNVVAGRVAAKYGFTMEEGTNYLEKIIQIPFELPPLDHNDIKRFISKQYRELGWDIPEVFATGLTSNPRTIKRALNRYRILLGMAEKRVAAWVIDSLDPQLVAKVVVLQTAFKELYAHLTDEPGYLLKVEEWAQPPEEAPPVDALASPPGNSPGRPSANPPPTDPPGLKTLVGARDIEALKAMMSAGNPRFGSQEERDHVHWYIFLGGDVAGAQDDFRPSQYRDGLLSNKPAQIAETLKLILTDDLLDNEYMKAYVARLRKTYTDRLTDILGKDARYKRDQRLSANLALDLIESREQLPEGPQTVRVPGVQYRLGLSDKAYVDIAKESGIELKIAKNQSESYGYPRDFRIGRYPVTNGAFAQFAAEVKPVDFEADIVECEAYWPPCRPRTRDDKEASKISSTHQVRIFPGQQALMEASTYHREDESEAAEVTLSLSAATGERVLQFAVISKPTSGDRYEHSFDIPLGKDLSASQTIQVNEGSSLTQNGMKWVFETKHLFVRVRAVADEECDEYREFLEPPSADQPFKIDIAVWDRKTIPSLSPPSTLDDWKPANGANHPVTRVTWEEAVSYCKWLRWQTGLPYRLPTEIEWELAAKGATERLFPWGNYWSPTMANTQETRIGTTTPVKENPEGDSPYCCADMAGNVMEWCADTFSKAFYDGISGHTWQDVKLHGKPTSEEKNLRIIRGSSFNQGKAQAVSINRDGREASHPSEEIGFRVAISSSWESIPDRH